MDRFRRCEDLVPHDVFIAAPVLKGLLNTCANQFRPEMVYLSDDATPLSLRATDRPPEIPLGAGR